MKKTLMYTLFALAASSNCVAQRDNEIKDAIMKNKHEWINSWADSPLINFQTKNPRKISPMPGLGNSYDPINEPFYSYSPSRRFFTDIYSTSLMFYIDGQDTVLGSADPDCEIVLFDTQANTQSRLLFEGSITHYEDAVWVTDSTFVVLGSNDYDEIHPIILFFDLNKMEYYYYVGVKNKRKYGYVEECKFKGMFKKLEI
jgi:hypothetical protein